MKFVCLSDTHGKHKEFVIPECDVLLHAGDFTSMGRLTETIDFLRWLEVQPAKHKIFISGNHDFLDQDQPGVFDELLKEYAPSCNYLRDSGIEVEGIKIWGRPWTPQFNNWAFMEERGSLWTKASLLLIPDNTNILLTHGPCYQILDHTPRGEQVGCKDSRRELSRLNLKYYIHGHVHFASGIEEVMGITFINCAVLDESYRKFKEPVVFDYENK